MDVIHSSDHADRDRLPRHASRWTGIALVSAAPSFFAAQVEYHVMGMLTGIAIWVALLSYITSSRPFGRLARVRGVRATLYLGYGLRILASVLMPFAFVWEFSQFFMYVDGMAGMASIALGGRFGFDGHGLFSTLVITLIQGGLLNLMVGLVMLVLYPLVWLFSGKFAGTTNP